MKKNFFKAAIIYVLAVLLLGFAAGTIKDSLDASKADEVVLCFAVTSKTYVFDEADRRLSNFINRVYDYAEKREYGKVDAFVVNGDLTGDGSSEAFAAVDMFASDLLRPGSRIYTTIGEMDFANESVEAYNSKILKNGMDYATNIGGCGFVFLSSEYNSYANKMEWLDKTLAEMTADNDKPVFVFQYAALGNTFYGTETWYTYESQLLMDVLEKYPTVVDFASSTVGPGNTVRSIFQKNATYVNNGGMTNIRLNYNEFGYDTSKDMVNSRFTNVSQCKIIEVYGDGRVEIVTMDLNSGELYRNGDGTEILKFVVYPGKNESYTYTNEKNVSASRPTFTEGAAVKLQDTEDGGLLVQFDSARDLDGILFYNIKIKDRNGSEIANESFYSDFALIYEPKVLERIIENVKSENVGSIEITPFDMFGSSGNSLTAEY